jgi:hypothetical protein
MARTGERRLCIESRKRVLVKRDGRVVEQGMCFSVASKFWRVTSESKQSLYPPTPNSE